MFDSCIEIPYNNNVEWHKIRATGIGGSDSSILLGVSSHKNMLTLWQEKVGIIKAEDISQKECIIKGNLLEPILADYFAIKYPQFEVIEPKVTFRSKEYPFMLANVDRVLRHKETGELGVLEIKTTTVNNFGLFMKEWKNTIPDPYYSQVMHYHIVTQSKYNFVISDIDFNWERESEIKDINNIKDNTVSIYELNQFEQSDINYLIKKELEFNEYITNLIEPPYTKNLEI